MKVYIITSAKHEEIYLKEWIDYNISLGIDKIIINDNNEIDYPYKLKDVIKEYVDKGIVIIDRYYDTHKLESIIAEKELNKVYTYLYNKYKNEFDYCLKIDIDEFVYCPETNNDIKKFIQQDKFKQYDEILLNWINYRSKTEYLDQYVPLPIQMRFKELHEPKYKLCCKSIIKSLAEFIELNHHVANIDNDKKCLANGLNLNDALSKDIVEQQNRKINLKYEYNEEFKQYAYIKHYRYRNEEETLFRLEKLENHLDPNKPYALEKYNKLKHIKKRDLYQIYLNRENKDIC